MIEKVGGLIKEVFPNHNVSSIQSLGRGCINIAYSVSLRPKKELILRLFPFDPWKAEKERYIHKLVGKRTNIPVSKVYKIDSSRKVFEYSYILQSKLKGKKLVGDNKRLVEKAGEYLAKIHSIKFNKFGWIIKNKIEPGFDKWVDFLEYDLEHKSKKSQKGVPGEIVKGVRKYFNNHKNLLRIRDKPCLLHKDYHYSHILTKDKKITGVIDWEWAIAGHNELDIAKSCLWMFERDRKLMDVFLNGYKKHGSISREFEKRKKIYDVLVVFSSLAFSCELKSKKWYGYNLKKLKRLTKNF